MTLPEGEYVDETDTVDVDWQDKAVELRRALPTEYVDDFDELVFDFKDLIETYEDVISDKKYFSNILEQLNQEMNGIAFLYSLSSKVYHKAWVWEPFSIEMGKTMCGKDANNMKISPYPKMGRRFCKICKKVYDDYEDRCK